MSLCMIMVGSALYKFKIKGCFYPTRGDGCFYKITSNFEKTSKIKNQKTALPKI